VKRDQAPVVPGRLYGLRSWTAGDKNSLRSLAQDEVWEKGPKPTRARCLVARGHRAPDGRCGCGLYALHPTAAQCAASFQAARCAARSDEPEAEVVGIVAAWGEVELHESGFRAEYARSHALLLPAVPGGPYAHRVRALAAAHESEVWEVGSATDLHRRCVDQNLGLSETAVRELLGRKLRRHAAAERLKRWREAVVDVAAMAIAVVGSCLIPGLIVVSALVSLLGGEADRESRAPPRASKLEILEQRLIEIDGSDLYVALVRNPSKTRSALRVHPKGRFLDDYGDPIGWPDDPAGVDNRPSLAPGQVGVVYDWVDYYESVADQVERIRVRLVASRWVPGRRRSPVGVSRLRLERPLCLVTATVSSAWRRLEAELAVVVRNRRGRIIGAGTWFAGPLAKGRSRRILEKIDPRPCLRERIEFEAYPNLRAGELVRAATSRVRAKDRGPCHDAKASPHQQGESKPRCPRD
jgi:hypothetical protein